MTGGHGPSSRRQTRHRLIKLADGQEIFYREAGVGNPDTILLLHGFPSSSHMFRNLIPELADAFHVVAPDLPGFGLSSVPGTAGFEAMAESISAFLDIAGIARFALYVMDYGAPVGFRVMLEQPDRIRGIVVQNGNAYEDGLLGFWDPLRALWKVNSSANRDALRPFLTLEGTRSQYTAGVKDLTRLDPAAWIHDQAFLDRPGDDERQLDLFYDYRTNVARYPRFQECFRQRRYPTLIAWGANDAIFPAEGARAFLRDLPDAELHLLDTGHFALEDKLEDVVPLMRAFLGGLSAA